MKEKRTESGKRAPKDRESEKSSGKKRDGTWTTFSLLGSLSLLLLLAGIIFWPEQDAPTLQQEQAPPNSIQIKPGQYLGETITINRTGLRNLNGSWDGWTETVNFSLPGYSGTVLSLPRDPYSYTEDLIEKYGPGKRVGDAFVYQRPGGVFIVGLKTDREVSLDLQGRDGLRIALDIFRRTRT